MLSAMKKISSIPKNTYKVCLNNYQSIKNASNFKQISNYSFFHKVFLSSSLLFGTYLINSKKTNAYFWFKKSESSNEPENHYASNDESYVDRIEGIKAFLEKSGEKFLSKGSAQVLIDAVRVLAQLEYNEIAFKNREIRTELLLEASNLESINDIGVDEFDRKNKFGQKMALLKPLKINITDNEKLKQYCEEVLACPEETRKLYLNLFEIALKDVGLTKEEYELSIKKLIEQDKRFNLDLDTPFAELEMNISCNWQQIDMYSKNSQYLESYTGYMMAIRDLNYDYLNQKIGQQLGFKREAEYLTDSLICDALYFSHGLYKESVYQIHLKLDQQN